MKNWITPIKYLYREITVYNLIFTALSINILIYYGPGSLAYIFWMKVIGYAFTTIAYYWSRKRHLYFFHNLQLNRVNLFIISTAIDLVITILLLSTINLFLQ
ncbi:MAG: hypothetical protein NXI20_21330 [bacterium]|nr:hypothetical protein [bacterium]